VKDHEVAYGPQALPGGRGTLFTIADIQRNTPSFLLLGDIRRWDRARIVLQTHRGSEATVLVTGGSDGRYLPTGHIVYAVGGTLFAVPFDPNRLPRPPHASAP